MLDRQFQLARIADSANELYVSACVLRRLDKMLGARPARRGAEAGTGDRALLSDDRRTGASATTSTHLWVNDDEDDRRRWPTRCWRSYRAWQSAATVASPRIDGLFARPLRAAHCFLCASGLASIRCGGRPTPASVWSALRFLGGAATAASMARSFSQRVGDVAPWIAIALAADDQVAVGRQRGCGYLPETARARPPAATGCRPPASAARPCCSPCSRSGRRGRSCGQSVNSNSDCGNANVAN